MEFGIAWHIVSVAVVFAAGAAGGIYGYRWYKANVVIGGRG